MLLPTLFATFSTVFSTPPTAFLTLSAASLTIFPPSFAKQIVKEKIKETDGDLFETYIFLYDMAIENFMKKEDEDLYKQIFINIKSSDESIFDLMKNTKPKDVIKYCDLLNTKNLKIENQQDFMVICEMLNAITRKAIIKNFKGVFNVF